MIFEKNCLFLYPKDLIPDFRGIEPKDVNISMFLKNDAPTLSNNISHSKIILYIDNDRRLYKHLQGPRKGKVDIY